MSASGPPREPSRASDRTCIVVGAGAAGLSCALRLQQHGVRVTLLEAADRVGGRCLTTSVGDLGVFELGAQWFHGQKGNPAFALAESLGLTPQTPKRRATTPRHLRSDGRPANADVVRSASRLLFETVSELEAGRGGAHASVGAAVRAAWEAARPGLLASHGDGALLDAAWEAAEKLQCAIDGCGDLADECAGVAYASYDDFDGRHVPSRPDLGGFSKALEALAAPLRASGALLQGRAARAVRWGDAVEGGGVEVDVEGSDGRAATHSAAAACLCVPLEPLRRLRLEPPLSEARAGAMRHFACGAVEKIFVSVERRRPEAEEGGEGELPSLHLLWTEPARGSTADPLAGGWTRGLYSLHRADASSGEGAAASLPSGWSRSRCVLVGWLTGESARAVSGRPSRELLRELEAGLAPFWRLLPSWRPVAVHATSWTANPLFGGSYSYPRPAAPADAADRLAAPLVCGGLPTVCFAGEATHTRCFGTVAGAMLSGEREAERLLTAWDMHVEDPEGSRHLEHLECRRSIF